MGRQGQLGRVIVLCACVAAWLLACLPISWAQARSAAPDGYRLGLVKQFEETSYDLRDVDFIRDDVGWAVGKAHWDQSAKAYQGTIVKTGDGGRSWVALWNIPNVPLNAVDFYDDDKGWAVGADGTVLLTYNGGEDWELHTIPLNDELRGVHFVSTIEGWATSARLTDSDGDGEPDNWQAGIWHTRDGGESWLPQILPSAASILNDVVFANALQGWAVGAKRIGYDGQGQAQDRAAIYHTDDGGVTWTEQTCASPEFEATLTAVDAVDGQHAWAVGIRTTGTVSSGLVLHTDDGGATWQYQVLDVASGKLWDVAFIDAQRGYAVGSGDTHGWGGPVWRTLDGGENWERVRLALHEGDGLYGVAVVNSQAVAVGDHGFMARSSRAWDSCEVFIPEEPCLDCQCLFDTAFIGTHYDFQDVFFHDASHGWAVGRYSDAPKLSGQVILHTSDGGQRWAIQYRKAPPEGALDSPLGLYAVQFIDAQTGWAAGTSHQQQGGILHTVDGGQHWTEQGQELYGAQDREFFGLHFLDDREGWALSSSHFPSDTILLAHTTDGGQHWQWVDSGIEGALPTGLPWAQGDVAFCDAQRGWAVGGLGKVIHTADGGTTWSSQALDCGSPACEVPLYALHMLDCSEGWIAGGEVYRTTDGGTLWDQQDLAGDAALHDVQFLDTNHGWLAGEGGAVWYTADGGTLWRKLDNQVSPHRLLGLSFVSPQQGWFVGLHGTILATVQMPSWLVYLPLLRR